MGEIAPGSDQLQNNGIGQLTAEDWEQFRQRSGGAGGMGLRRGFRRGFGGDQGRDAGGNDTPPVKSDEGNRPPQAQAKKPGEGDGAPGSEASGEAGAEPSDNPPDGDDGEGKTLPPWVARRIKREKAAAQKQIDAANARNAELEARIAELEGRRVRNEAGSGETPKELTPAAQYEALGLDESGPDTSDYDDEAHWTKDMSLFLERKLLEHHPKIADLGAAPSNGKPEGGENGAGAKTELEKAQEEYRRRWDLAWQTLDAAFDTLDKVEESPYGLEDFEKFLADHNAKRISVDVEMMEHIAQSDDGALMASLIMKSPEKSFRIFGKPLGERGKHLDAMVQRHKNAQAKAKRGAAAGEQPGDEPGGGDGKILPDLPGSGEAGTGGEEQDLATASFEDYVAIRQSQTERRNRRPAGWVT